MCKRSQEPHQRILVPLHDVVSPAKSLSIETCCSQGVARARLHEDCQAEPEICRLQVERIYLNQF